jgi:hypothetical protein
MEETGSQSQAADTPESSVQPRLLPVRGDMGASASSTATEATSTGRSPHHSRTPSARRRAETQDSDKAGRSWAREVDDPWWPCILTLDGGGIRGYSSLLILKELMHEVWLWEVRLDKEEETGVEDDDEGFNNVTVESPTSIHRPQQERDQDQVAAGAENNAEEVEAKYGVEVPESPQPNPNETPQVPTVNHDNLTSRVTAKKALSEEELLPCHYFDFMYGTSTGGLIATILGRLRMTVTEGLELYRKVGDDLFGKRRSHIPLMTKYYHQPLEKAVQDIVGSRCHEHENCDGKDDLHPWDVDDDRFAEIVELRIPFDVDLPRVCQSCCLTATHDRNLTEAYLLRSYPHYYSEASPNWIARYNEGADELPIWKVTRATTAAPFYFVSTLEVWIAMFA